MQKNANMNKIFDYPDLQTAVQNLMIKPIESNDLQAII